MNLSLLFSFNALAILVSGVLSLFIGFIWYGPLFAKPWSAYSGWTEEKIKTLSGGSMARSYILTFVIALIQALVLSFLARAFGITDPLGGLTLGLLTGLGFVATGFATSFLFEHKPFGYWAIVSGYEVVYLAAAGAIVSAWR